MLSSKKVKAFVDDLYITVKWKPDPPGELEWKDDKYEENEAFGVVEFTVSTERDEQ